MEYSLRYVPHELEAPSLAFTDQGGEVHTYINMKYLNKIVTRVVGNREVTIILTFCSILPYIIHANVLLYFR